MSQPSASRADHGEAGPASEGFPRGCEPGSDHIGTGGRLAVFVPDFSYLGITGRFSENMVGICGDAASILKLKFVPIHLTYSLIGKLHSMARSVASDGLWAASPTMNHFSSRRGFDARPGDRILVGFHTTWTVVRRLVRNLDIARIFAIVHNIESVCRERRGSAHVVNRLVPAIERWNVASLRRLDHELGGCHLGCVSYTDMEALRSMAIPCKTMEFVGWTTLLRDQDIHTARNALGREAGAVDRTLVFMANGKNPDNRVGLEWFLRRVAPALPEPRGWKLLLVGPGWRDFEVTSPLTVEHVGYVDQLSTVLARGMIAINPDVSGVGVKTKMLDYAAAGLPAISTHLGVRGLPPAGWAHLKVFDGPEEWATALWDLQDKGRWAECSKQMSAMGAEYGTRAGFLKRMCAFLSRVGADPDLPSSATIAVRTNP